MQENPNPVYENIQKHRSSDISVRVTSIPTHITKIANSSELLKTQTANYRRRRARAKMTWTTSPRVIFSREKIFKKIRFALKIDFSLIKIARAGELDVDKNNLIEVKVARLEFNYAFSKKKKLCSAHKKRCMIALSYKVTVAT